MDIEDNNVEQPCTQYIYEENYIGYFVKYDNDLEGVRQIIGPSCIDVINTRFLVAYKDAPALENPQGFLQYGYNNLPKPYGLMDVPAVEDIGAFAVRSLPGLRLTGRDVMVGLVDTGIDYKNSAFMDDQGRTRIAYIWDQNQAAMEAGQPVFGYGGEFDREDINRAIESANPYDIVPSRDEVGHGTFLASIAAGREALEENFSGVAPEANIIMVKLKEANRALRDFYYIGGDKTCYAENDIAQGIRYLINKAVQLRKPMVICLGVGTNQGAHDGSSNLELYIQSLSGLRGICFVAPAGNELGGRNHYQSWGLNNIGIGPVVDTGTGAPEQIRTVDSGRDEIVEINVEEGVTGFVTEIWGNAPGLLRVMVESPSGERLDNIIPNLSGSNTGDFLFEGSTVFVENIVVEATTGDQLYFMRFSNPAKGIWKIIVNESLNMLGQGFNLWLPLREFVGDKVRFVRPSPDISITSPGNTVGCITVAAYNNDSGAIYVESSRGYTRRGGVKPDITAPGVDIKGVFAGGDRTLYTEKSGSSVATAFVAGAAALMLQWGIVDRNNLGINTEIIKQLFIRGAMRKNQLVYPNNIWGWGTLDILQTFQNTRQ